jgi:P-type E1-E2 ATPase
MIFNFKNENQKEKIEDIDICLDLDIENYEKIKCEFLIGNKKFIEDLNSIKIPDEILKLISNINKNSSIIFTCLNKEILGIFSIDTSSIIRPELKFIIEKIEMNKKNEVYILSGDNNNAVNELGKNLQIKNENCIGGVSDFEKKQFLSDLKNNKNKKVLMIGDGINDVLSLSEADFGISFNSNSQFNLVASDIIFLKEDLNLLLKLMKISKFTFNFIWINIFWAFIYNIIMIPITSGIFYSFWDYLMSPTISSLAMLGSSILILLTSNFLRLFI